MLLSTSAYLRLGSQLTKMFLFHPQSLTFYQAPSLLTRWLTHCQVWELEAHVSRKFISRYLDRILHRCIRAYVCSNNTSNSASICPESLTLFENPALLFFKMSSCHTGMFKGTVNN